MRWILLKHRSEPHLTVDFWVFTESPEMLATSVSSATEGGAPESQPDQEDAATSSSQKRAETRQLLSLLREQKRKSVLRRTSTSRNLSRV